MKDIIIVGSGIAACSLAWQLHKSGKSFTMITDLKKGSSAVAAGVYNPMVLKRFTSVWKAQEQLEVMNNLYDYIKQELTVEHRHNITVARRFHDEKEAATWVKKSVREDLSPFMQPEVQYLNLEGIEGVVGYGFVNGTGWVNTMGFMKSTIDFFEKLGCMYYDSLEFTSLNIQEDNIQYKHLQAKEIIFAEGYRMLDNPYFSNLPLQGNKGEVLIVKIPNLKLDYIIKSSVFLMPYKEDLFWVGATYDRDDLNDAPTAAGKEFLISRLEKFLKVPYEVIDHKHGIRPTTQDRRPFVGHHSTHKNLYIFNGMGSRAVLLAPWAAQQLIDYMYKGETLNPEINIARFM